MQGNIHGAGAIILKFPISQTLGRGPMVIRWTKVVSAYIREATILSGNVKDATPVI